MRQRYFHCCPISLEIGSIIHKGNWGRVMSLYATDNDSNRWTAYRETMFEYGRKLICPDKPSRLDCVFACLSLRDAFICRSVTNQLSQLIYEVEPIEDNAVTHKGSYSIVTRSYKFNLLNEMNQQILDYWDDSEKEDIEILIHCSVRVLSKPIGDSVKLSDF